jgi:DNA-binding MarR family transcriptional regulator
MGTNISAAGTREVIDAIRRIVQALRESSHQAESRVGLSGAQLFILRTVAEAPGLSLNELADRTRTHQSSVSVVVTHLASKGLVEKRTADRDGRRVAIRVSARGRQRLDRAPQTAQERLIASVDGLPGSERARLARSLERLVRGMALPRKRPAMFFEGAAPRAAARRVSPVSTVRRRADV